MHHTKYPDCDDNYIEEVARRLVERVCDHSVQDHKSHILKHSYENAHKNEPKEDFCILGNGFSKNRFKRKISEALFI